MAVRADQYYWFNGVDDNAIASLGCYHQLTDEIVGAVVTSIFMYKKAYLI